MYGHTVYVRVEGPSEVAMVMGGQGEGGHRQFQRRIGLKNTPHYNNKIVTFSPVILYTKYLCVRVYAKFIPVCCELVLLVGRPQQLYLTTHSAVSPSYPCLSARLAGYSL